MLWGNFVLDPTLEQSENIFDHIFGVSDSYFIDLLFSICIFCSLFKKITIQINRFSGLGNGGCFYFDLGRLRKRKDVIRVKGINDLDDPIFKIDFCYFDQLFLFDAGEVVFNQKLVIFVGEKLYFYPIFMSYFIILNDKFWLEGFGIRFSDIENVDNLSFCFLSFLVHSI